MKDLRFINNIQVLFGKVFFPWESFWTRKKGLEYTCDDE